jgi:hypothetical protein
MEIEDVHMIRKLKSGQYHLYSRKKDPKTGKLRNLEPLEHVKGQRLRSVRCNTSSATGEVGFRDASEIGQVHILHMSP